MRFGPQAVLIPALASSAPALLLFARRPVDGTYIDRPFAGDGPDRARRRASAFPALMMLAMSGATRRTPGSPRAWSTRRVQVGGAIGLAVLATLATERTEASLRRGESRDAALNAGYHLAYLIGAVLVGSRSPSPSVFLKSPDMGAMTAAHGEEKRARSGGQGRDRDLPLRGGLGLRPPHAGRLQCLSLRAGSNRARPLIRPERPQVEVVEGDGHPAVLADAGLLHIYQDLVAQVVRSIRGRWSALSMPGGSRSCTT